MLRFITSTTYGQWLPGDERGFVSNVRTGTEHRDKHNRYGVAFDKNMPGLKNAARNAMKGEPVFLTLEQAKILIEQFRETATFRNWLLVGVAVMANHFHALLEIADAENPENVLRDLKSYGSRKLNERFGKPESGTWWTTSGSNRPKRTDDIPTVIRYLKNQKRILALWIDPQFDPEPGALAPGETLIDTSLRGLTAPAQRNESRTT